MNINISLCRVCLKQGPGTNIYTANILEKYLFTTLVQVSRAILLLHNPNKVGFNFQIHTIIGCATKISVLYHQLHFSTA